MGQGSGSQCAEALAAAEHDAWLLANQGAPNCVACNTRDSVQSCSPGGGAYYASWTLHYRCQSCSFDPL